MPLERVEIEVDMVVAVGHIIRIMQGHPVMFALGRMHPVEHIRRWVLVGLQRVVLERATYFHHRTIFQRHIILGLGTRLLLGRQRPHLQV